jgi:hypothetical protein
MPRTKTSTLNLRIDPLLKHAVRQAADQEHRSVANMIEMLIRRHCSESGIEIDTAPHSSRRKNDA